jgi:hypothetical protein
MNPWKKLPLPARLVILLASGAVLVFLQLFVFNALVMLAGMILLLIAFFSVGEAPSEPYTDAHKLRLFYAPLFMAVIGASAGFFLYRNVAMIIATAILAAGIYSMLIRQMVLAFNGWRIYKGFYAFIAAAALCIIALFMIMLWMLNTAEAV